MSTTPTPSPSTPTPLFGRKWKLEIKSAPSAGSSTVITFTDADTDTPMRITFDVHTQAWKDLWFAHICIYNPNEQTANFILSQGKNSGSAPGPNASAQTPPVQQGMEVILSAGYGNGGNFGIIWDGFVLQPLWERENQVDFKITLNCVLGLDEISRNWVGRTFSAQTVNQLQVVQSIMQNSFHPIQPGTISSKLATKQLPRGETIFGPSARALTEIARDNNMNWFLSQRGLLNMGKVDEDLAVTLTNVPSYSPTTGLVGTPVQTQFGIQFRLLLDPTVQVKKPLMCVNVNHTQVRQLLQQVGVLQGILSQDGTYVVVGARYTGDSRGQAWYTEVTGALLAQDKLAAIQRAMGDVQAWTG